MPPYMFDTNRMNFISLNFNIKNMLLIFNHKLSVIIISFESQRTMEKQYKYEELQKIGKGQFGIVIKVKRIEDGKIMVKKQIQYGSMSRQQKNQLVNEVNILKDLCHEHIVKYYEHTVDRKNTYVNIFMQFCPGGDLGTALAQIKKKKQYLDQDTIWKLFFQLTTALNYCHRKKILHRDLKPANIFIDSTKTNIKVGDFGLSKQLGQHSQYARTYVGTPFYMSPEQIKNKKYNEKSDIWSLGCIIYQLAALKRPFNGTNIIQLGHNIESGKFEPLPQRYSTNLQNVISRMLSTNPESRPNALDILNLPLMKIRLQQKQIKAKYEQLKRKQEYLKYKQEQYKQKIKQLQQLKDLAKTNNLKKTTSIVEANRGRSFKSLTISI